VTRALVTGSGGFVGQWLTLAMLRRGWSVVGAGNDVPPTSTSVLTPADRHDVRWVRADVRTAAELDALIESSTPDVVAHLAAMSFIPDAQDAPSQAYDVNVLGTVRLLSALSAARREGKIDPTVLVIGSGMQYGRHEQADMPLDEHAEQRPLTVYAATKAAQELAALQLFRAEGLRVVCTRSFNHSGAGHADHFLLPALVKRALELRANGGTSLRIGNADAVRDYLHVADVVTAYLLLIERGEPGTTYNVCSGEGVSARQLATDVLLRVGVTADISTVPELVRSVDVPTLVGSARRLRALGWEPTHTRNDIIDDLIHAATR
jgi:GDP-4-dehydro-6-deoxy-D-mannose reductase